MPHPKTESDWEAESDLDALEQAKAVMGDPKRLARAKQRVAELADAASERKDAFSGGSNSNSLAQGFRKI